jgi:hypothetical protein
MLSHRDFDSTFAKEVLTQFDMKDSRLSYDVMRQALVRFKELTDNTSDFEECPKCGAELHV